MQGSLCQVQQVTTFKENILNPFFFGGIQFELRLARPAVYHLSHTSSPSLALPIFQKVS
jgi:hypothetical protein